MNPIVDFKALPERIRSAGKRVMVAVASPADSHTEEVIERSISENFAQFTLVAVEGKQTIACRLAADYREEQQSVHARYLCNGYMCKHAAFNQYAMFFVEHGTQQIVGV